MIDLEKLDERDGFNNGGFKPNGGQDGWHVPMADPNVEFNNNGTQDNNGIFLPNQGGETNPFIGTERVNEVDVIPQEKKEEVKEKAKRAWGVALGKDALVGADLKKQNKRNYYLG